MSFVQKFSKNERKYLKLLLGAMFVGIHFFGYKTLPRHLTQNSFVFTCINEKNILKLHSENI